MNIVTKDIPAGIALQYPEEHGESLPDVAVENGRIVFPAFVRKNAEIGGYDWIPVRIPYKGQKMDDYSKLMRECYAELRRFFYGTTAQQLELQYKGKFDDHIEAVRKAFPNPYKQERRTIFFRFEVLKAFQTIPDLYDQVVNAYQTNIEVQLFWNSVNSIDIENEYCIRIRQQLGITDEMVDTLIQIIENENNARRSGQIEG